MKLYYQVGRVFNELRELGIGPDDPLDVKTLVTFDQYHCLGTAAVDEAVSRLGLDASSKVLEVGSGIGGPSRYLADGVGCTMTALELQPNLNETAQALTDRCGLSKRVLHVCGDMLEGAPSRDFDAVVSWLAFLHIPERSQLYARCFEALRPGGGIYVEDYFPCGELTAGEREILARDVFCKRVPSLDEYTSELTEAGFERIDFADVTDPWTGFLRDRLNTFRESRERNLRVHGADVVDALDDFYEVMVTLFDGGNLGGLRFTAWKPS